MNETERQLLEDKCDLILDELFEVAYTRGHEEPVVILSMTRFLGFMLANAPNRLPLDATLGVMSGLIRASYDKAVTSKESVDLMKRLKGDAK